MMEHLDYDHIQEAALSIETLNVGFSPGSNTMLESSRESELKKAGENKVTLGMIPYNMMNFSASMVTPPTMYSHIPMMGPSLMSPVARNYASPIVRDINSLYPCSLESTPIRSNVKAARVDKCNKGLRHFSMKVLQKVQAKGKTTYNEVADELVYEFGNKSNSPEKKTYDHKNIRRRVYDALNVLMAMKIIHKEKREIQWVGLPSNSVHEIDTLKKRYDDLEEKVEKKIEIIRSMLIQEISLTTLIKKNQESELRVGAHSLNKIEMPFTAITTSNFTTVDCTVTSPKDDYYFVFSGEYQVYDETAITKKLGSSLGLDLGLSTDEQIEEMKRLLPKSIHALSEAIGRFPPDELHRVIASFGGAIGSTSNVASSDLSCFKSMFNAWLFESIRLKRESKPDKSIPNDVQSIYQNNV